MKVVTIPSELAEDILHFVGRDCHYDHHGYCQAHGLQPKGQCFAERLRDTLAEATDRVAELERMHQERTDELIAARRERDAIRSALAKAEKSVAELKAEVDRCHARLEIDHQFLLSGDGGEDLVRVEVPIDQRANQIDGIEARDATIAELERQIAALEPAPAHPEEPWPEAAKFKWGDRVRKIKGASWTGRVCGIYSTALTPLGYAVESENEPGSVQIYPEAALEPAPAPQTKWEGPGSEEHEYSPDYQAMGDCRVCGHTYEAHSPAPARELVVSDEMIDAAQVAFQEKYDRGGPDEDELRTVLTAALAKQGGR